MKKISYKLLIMSILCFLVLGLTACSDDAAGSGSSDSKLELGKNAFYWNVQVKYSTSNPSSLAIYTEPMREESKKELEDFWTRDKSGASEPGKGNLGFQAIVPGKKKGNKAELDGSFTLYNGSLSGPSKVVNIKGSYPIEDEADLEQTPSYFIFTDEGFREVSKEEWNSFRP